jgi:transcriptional regulator with PAS, ATPase and Fis domain
VLITGETGTGKELVATAVHQRSPWVRGPLIKVNCATISEDVPGLVLFGYPPNPALGQADQAGRAGLIEQAHRGTLFLDEIQTMGLKVQPQLLRVLEEKRVRRIGADRETEVEVRFVVATNEDLRAKVRAGEFRADLYERLRRRTLVLPPLRARPEDVPLLVHYFLDREPGSPRWISRQALEQLMRHDWPGNVRELEHCLGRAKAQDKEVIFSWDLGLEEGRHSSPEPAVAQPAAPARAELRRQPRPITEVEKEAIQESLEWTRGNKAQAARLLGWTWQTLDSKMKRYGVE